MRKIKTTSYSQVNAYEKRLLAHAESEEHGDYSNYVKRLVGRDMEERGRALVASTFDTTPAPPVEVTEDFSGFI